MLEQFLKWPKLVLSSVYEKIAEQATKANTNVKEYLGNDSNIEHISAVVYDAIPFFLKFSLKPETFNTKFQTHFKVFRDKMYSYDDELNADKNKEQKAHVLKDWEEAQQIFQARADSINDDESLVVLKGSMSAKEIREKVNSMKIQAHKEQKFKEAYQERIDTPENSVEIFNSKDYPNGISAEEVLAKIDAMVPNQNKVTRTTMLKDFKEQNAIFKKQKSSTKFISDMSHEEIREKFLNLVSEARNNSVQKKPVRARRVKAKINDKAIDESHDVIMERTQSCSSEDLEKMTHFSSEMSREEIISKFMRCSLEDAKKLDQENRNAEFKKVARSRKPKNTTTKVATTATRKKKTEE